MQIAVLIHSIHLSMVSSVSILLFSEEKVEGMNKNDSEFNLEAQACMVYGKNWVSGSGKPISGGAWGTLN